MDETEKKENRPPKEILEEIFETKEFQRVFGMTAVEILESGKEYTRDELRKLLSGHLCRCTGYENILNAVEKTMKRRLQKG